jgi:TetR/AcrR family transcriptional repressor of lmrAB and yxaGH operons
MAETTRDQMIQTATRLFRRHGYNATSWRVLIEEAGTPWGSIQHHFPGGKEELGVEAIGHGSAQAVGFLESCFDQTASAPAAIRRWFDRNAAALERTEFEYGCPIATVALETTTTSPTLAAASADAFERLLGTLVERFVAAGIPRRRARELGTLVFTSFEGALVVARVKRSAEPLRVAGRQLETLVRDALPR